MMNFWGPFFSALLFSLAAMSAGKINVSEAHGPIALGFGPGYANYRVMNEDGSWAGYKGASYLGSLEVRVLSFDSAAISIFGDYTLGQTTESSQGGATLEHTSMSYGLRLYPTNGFFVGVGYGTGSEKLSQEGVSTTLKHHFTKIGLGFEWRLTGSWALGLQSYYKSGPISREENSSLGSNSSFEGVEGFLLLIWSPSVLNVINN